MPKTDSWANVQNLNQVIRFNTPATVTGTDGDGNPTSSQGYYAITIVTNTQAVSNNGGLRDIQKITNVGTPRATIFTPAELASTVKGASNSTGNFLLGELTAVYTDAIGGVA